MLPHRAARHHPTPFRRTNLGATDDQHRSLTVPTSAISVPLAAKVPGHEGYDHCGDCRQIWPTDLVTYDAGPDDWFCPLCRAS